MTAGPPHHPVPHFGNLIGGTLLGAILLAVGMLMAYATVATPLVAELVPAGPAGRGATIGLGVWSFALIAGGGLLVAGTNRLAAILAMLRRGPEEGGPAARALASVVSAADEITVVGNVALQGGRPIPELVIGAFGVAVIHALPPAGQVRHGRAGWEVRTSDGWQPTEDPLDAAMRDADRVRPWLAAADLDFVVRVYAALVADDRSIERSPTCAVIAPQQILAWFASLPRQRTLTAGRRARLMTVAGPLAQGDRRP